MQGSRKGAHRDLLRSFSHLRDGDPLVTELRGNLRNTFLRTFTVHYLDTGAQCICNPYTMEECMKFIHTADIHWGMIPDSDKPWGKKREQAIRLTFQGIIEDARDSRADLLLISGDLFHRQP